MKFKSGEIVRFLSKDSTIPYGIVGTVVSYFGLNTVEVEFPDCPTQNANRIGGRRGWIVCEYEIESLGKVNAKHLMIQYQGSTERVGLKLTKAVGGLTTTGMPLRVFRVYPSEIDNTWRVNRKVPLTEVFEDGNGYRCTVGGKEIYLDYAEAEYLMLALQEAYTDFGRSKNTVSRVRLSEKKKKR